MAAKKANGNKLTGDEVGDIVDTSADVLADPRLEVSLLTLERVPARTTKFLIGVAGSQSARSLLAKRGWGDKPAQEGRDLLMAVLAPAPSPESIARVKAGNLSDERVSSAVRELDGLDEGHFGVAKTALLHNFIQQHDFVFHELGPSTGPAAVTGWRTFLTRVQALRSGDDRKDTRKQDHAALALLAERGLDETELTRIEKLVRIAEGIGAEITLVDNEDEKVRIAALKKLWSWYSQWAAVARVEIKGKALRIRLGLAKRASGRGGAEEDEGDEDEGGAPTPAPMPED